MRTSIVQVLLALAVVTIYAANPTLRFTINPPGSPTAAPLVISPSSVFLSSFTPSLGTEVQWWNPMTGQAGPALSGEQYVAFSNTPIATGPASAIVYTNYAADSVVAFLTSSGVQWTYDRHNHTAKIAVSVTDQLAFVPYGSVAGSITGPVEVLEAFNINDPNEANRIKWAAQFVLPAGSSKNADITDLIYYEGSVFFMQDNLLQKVNATSGAVMSPPFPPCFTPTPGSPLGLKLVQYSEDNNGPLNALIIYGNSSHDTQLEFSACRISHHSGSAEWAAGTLRFSTDMLLESLTGGANAIFFNVIDRTTGEYLVQAVDGSSGTPLWNISRNLFDDINSYPTVLVSPMVLMQVQGSLTSINALTGVTAWTSPIPCHFTAIQYIDSIVCIRVDISLQLLNMNNGSLEWYTTQVSPAPYMPVSLDGYIFAIGSDNQLAVFSSLPVPPPVTKPPSNAGEIVGIIFAVIAIAAATGGIGFVFLKRSRRRKAPSGLPNYEDGAAGGYGGLSTN